MLDVAHGASLNVGTDPAHRPQQRAFVVPDGLCGHRRAPSCTIKNPGKPGLRIEGT